MPFKMYTHGDAITYELEVNGVSYGFGWKPSGFWLQIADADKGYQLTRYRSGFTGVRLKNILIWEQAWDELPKRIREAIENHTLP